MGTTQIGDIVTAVPVYVGPAGTGQRVADAMGGTYEINSNQEMLIADGGTAYTKGRITCTMSVNTIIPRIGMVNDLNGLLLGQVKVSVRMRFDGKFHTFTGVIQTGGGSWSHDSGKCTGDFKFIGSNVKRQ